MRGDAAKTTSFSRSYPSRHHGQDERPKLAGLVFGTLCGVLSAAIRVGAALATGAIPAAAAGAPGLASAVYSARQAMRGGDDFENAPLAYAALARKRLATP